MIKSQEQYVKEAVDRYEKEWWLEIPSFTEMKEIMKREITQAHTAGRNAEREELREWVEGEKKEPGDMTVTSPTSYNQALQDITDKLKD